MNRVKPCNNCRSEPKIEMYYWIKYLLNKLKMYL